MKAPLPLKKHFFALPEELKPFQDLPLLSLIKRVLKGEDMRLVDLNQVRANYSTLTKSFPYAEVYAALKAVSTPQVPELLRDLNARFEVASLEEALKLEKLKIPPRHIIFTHPDKDHIELQHPFVKKLKAFVSDSPSDLKTLARYVPKASVLIRISPLNQDQSIGQRFGVREEEAKKLILQALKLKLKPRGLTFHVGTQAPTAQAYKTPIQISARIFKDMRKQNIPPLDTLDLGGGLPALIDPQVPSYKEFGRKIKSYIDTYFKGHRPPCIFIEPGRSLSGTAGITLGRVISTKTLKTSEGKTHMVTLSTGRFNAGLIGIGQKLIFYRRHQAGFLRLKNQMEGAVYGKVSATMDKTHLQNLIPIPKNLQAGDLALCLGTGAYVDQMSTEWCGKKIPTNIIFDSEKSPKLAFKKAS